MLIATDLDGTLLAADSTEVPAYTASVLQRVDAAGIPVVFVTGRPLRWIEPLRRHIGRHGSVIASNGAITYDARAGEIVHLRGIGPEMGLALTRDVTARLPGAQFAIECAEGIRLSPDFREGFPMPHAPRGPLEEVWTDPAVKLLVRAPGVDSDELREAVTAAVGERATVTWSVPGLIEVSAAAVTKASALAALCAERGIDASEVVAFGDMPNDIAMLAWAGTAYAVEGAHESVVRVADRRAPACADEGVAQVLEGFAQAAEREAGGRGAGLAHA